MKNTYIKTEEGARLFAALAEADPESALQLLQKTVGVWSREEIWDFTSGRREIVWALEKMVVWRNLFQDAARILLILAEAENETWSNNASGIFVGLFSLGYGRVASTECPPAERFIVLKEAMESNSSERRKLALRACSAALETGHFSRIVGAEYQGLRKEPDLWMPKTYGELFDAYRQIWNYLYCRIEFLEGEEREEAVNILFSHIRSLGKIQLLAQMVIDTIRELIKRPYVNKKKLLEAMISFLHYDKKEMPEEILNQWKNMKEELTGSDFSSLLKRYVGMDVFEDHFDDEGNQIDQAQPKIEALAEQASRERELLESEMPWLVTSQAVNGYRFGYALGSKDANFELWNKLIKVQMNAEEGNVFFLSGYLRSIFEKAPQEWEKQLDLLIQNNKLNIHIPELTWRSGMSDLAARRILNLIRNDTIQSSQLGMFAYGSVLRNLSEDIFQDWIRLLLSDRTQNSIRIALDLYQYYYVYGEKEKKRILPEGLTIQLLTHPALFIKSGQNRRNYQMEEHNWTQIGKAFVSRYPEKTIPIAEVLIEHFGEEGTIFDRFHSPYQAVLDEISRQHPKEIWHVLIKYLDPPLDRRAFHIKEWLRGGRFFGVVTGDRLSLFPISEIWKWVDADIDVRAWHLASFIPKVLFRSDDKVCLARELLVRYGESEKVRSSLSANFWTEGWTGPASLHYSNKKKQFEELKNGETDKNVLRWLSDFIKSLDEEVDRAKKEEERRGY